MTSLPQQEQLHSIWPSINYTALSSVVEWNKVEYRSTLQRGGPDLQRTKQSYSRSWNSDISKRTPLFLSGYSTVAMESLGYQFPAVIKCDFVTSVTPR